MNEITLTIDSVTSLIKENKSDREIINMFKLSGYNITAVSDVIQRCKIKLSRVRGQNPGPVDPTRDFELRVWHNPRA
jgi:hypothetical protein